MYQLLRKDVAFKGLAVLLAILLWLYVVNSKNPPMEKTLMVPVAVLNLQDRLVLRNQPGEVEVRVKGPSSVINSLTSDDVKASVNMAAAEQGTGDYPVDVKLPTGVELVFKKPVSYLLTVDALETKQLPIQVITKGKVAQGYSSFEPVLIPSMVVVRGSAEVLKKIDTAVVTVDLNQATQNIDLNTPVSLLSRDGNPIPDDYEVSPKEVQVLVPITKPDNTITVAIKPQIVGSPKEGYQVSGVTIDPETVKISGPYEILSRINHVATAPLDITGIEDNYATQVALIPPDGASLVYQPVVKILVQVEPVAVEKTITDIPIAVTNPAEKHKYVIKPEKLNLVVKGLKADLERLDPSREVKAVVDVADLETGTHQLNVKVEVPEGLQIVKAEPDTVEVQITEEEIKTEGQASAAPAA